MTPETHSPEMIAETGLNFSPPYEETIDSWGVLLVLASNWRWIAGSAVLGAVVGVLLSILLHPTFTAEAIIVPPQQSTSATSSLLGQLGMISGLTGGSSFGLKSPADMYIGILQSRTIAYDIIAKFRLQKLYGANTLVDARVALEKHVKFESGKDSLIHLSVKDGDPNRASEIANGYLDELYKMNSQLATSEAAQRRSFYDIRLAEEKEALAQAESDLKNTQQKTGLIQLSGQASVIISSIAQLRADIASREVELQAMHTYATQDNPDAIRLEEEIRSLKTHLESLESSQRTLQPGDIQVPSGQLPEATLLYERQTRELKYHIALYDLLARQSEAARLDEAKSAPTIQVIDRAVPPDKKSGPSRKLITIGCTLFGFIVSCLWALARAAFRRIEQDPVRRRKLMDMRAALQK